MTTLTIIYLLIAIIVAGYFILRNRAHAAVQRADNPATALHSLPRYHGYYAALWAGLPALILLVLWLSLENTVIDGRLANLMPESMKQGADLGLALNDVKLAAQSNDTGDKAQLAEPMSTLVDYYVSAKAQSAKLKGVCVLLLALIGVGVAFFRLNPQFHARNRVERLVRIVLLLCASVAIITTVGIVFSVVFESLRFFSAVSPLEFIFGTNWSPTATEPKFGSVPLFAGTLLISFIALFIAVPIGLMTAIYLSEYANKRVRSFAKPVLELLAGIPTVVYGFFAALTVAPFIRDTFATLGLSASSESALAAGLVMGVMIIPFVSSLSDDVITAVPQYLRDGSLGLGATKSETIKQVVLPAAIPGIVGSILLAASRAIGETMIVVMAAGLAANLTGNPLESVTTVTVQIVTLLTGDLEFDTPKTLSAFALALMLFCITLFLNWIALRIVKRYREQYD
ncbi:phosphate ABC transporter permease subunit PstC [Ostreibacterium oceani]|uniref:Phosphate transport system permease protein n=1 Tax=Ostreibacterium oceani TaxID=2654998 RepID=A0A6N7EXB4_9GAMM|nr:phosphate ABC transporter permease subunit PstC [Ostreibacterium oceani]MPV86583.1 phosphate ABC transporter permease subunit PstC [Ostreibacterium oceani]